MTLKRKIEALRPQMAKAAQSVLDAWEQDEDGWDETLGAGGACDAIASALTEVVANAVEDVDITEGGHDGDDHAFIIAYDESEACLIDIPPSVYETGAGYNWTKKPNVTVTPDDIVIENVNREYVADW